MLTYSDGATLDDDGVLTVNNTDMQLSSDGTLSTTLEDLKYLWTRTIVTYSDGTSTTSYSVSCDGDDGKGIKSTDITYQASSSGTSEPTGTWESSIPNVPEGSFLWTRTVYTYSDDTTSIAYSVSKIGKQGEQGISVKSVTPEYYLSTSSTEVTGGNWVTIPPIKTNSTYIWKREHTIYEDNTESYSSAVLDQSLNELFNVTSELTVGQEEISAGIKDARGSYTSSKESLEGVKSTVTECYTDAINKVESNFNQRADNIELSVAQKENIPVTAVRYIRDWLYGIKDASSIDNKWVECDVIAQNTNIASGITPTYKNSSLTALTVLNPEYYTDGMLLDEALERYISSTENSCLEIDLGDVYYIRVWHYYEDNRVYNHKMQISTDGVSWVTIYDSDITGGYAETSYGKVYYLNNATIAENITSLNISSNQIESRVENIEGNFSSIKEQADKIESIVGSESEDGATGLISSINNLDNLIVKLRSEYEQYKSDSGTSISTLTQTMNEITSRIATVEGNTRDISEIRQDAKGWQALFAQLDMYDMPEIITNISIDINGITVTNPTTKQQTRITIDEFSGWYNNEKIFWIDKDTTKTRRLLCEKGWDTGADFIKMTTNSYTYSDGRTLNGVAYVKSGGSS